MARPHSSYGAPLDDYSPRAPHGQQHIINMGGIDGSHHAGSGGGGSAAGAYRTAQRSPLMASSPYSPRAAHEGAFDKQPASAYASPRQSHGGGLAPLQPGGGAAGQSSLSRSQSLGHHVYQQHHQQAQQHAQQQQGYAQHASSPAQPHQSAARGSYHRSRESAQPSYSDGSGGSYGTPGQGSGSSRSSLAGGGSLLPTINTQIPSGNFASSPYSPSGRNSMFAESSTSTYSAQPPMSRSPGHGKSGGSPYASAQAAFSSGSSHFQSPQQPGSQHRPLSMLESGTYSNFRDRAGTSPAQHEGARLAHRTSNTALRASAYEGGLPTYHAPSQPGDSLPYAYSTSALASAAAGLGQTGHPPPSLGAGGPPPRNSALYASEKDRRGSMPASTATGYDRDWQQQQQQGPSKVPQRPVPQVGFRRVRDTNDLRPNAQAAAQGFGRRADPAGGHVSPLKAMTTYLHHTYHLVNPAFFYELSFNPRRVLTKPSKPMHNDGHDNEDSDYILYVNDWLGAEEGNRYLILDVLGQGTFGQVVKCQNMKTHEIVAVKVIKNKPAYFHQSMMEVTILEMLNGSWDPNDEHHILRLRDTFIHAKHLCLVFELLSSNLYELIKQNSFRGLSTSLVRVFTAQLLDALTVLHEARLIHCDLKPENILLKTLQTPSIKLVDFGSACHERQTVYTYIQSRFYRSPEVLLGLPYSASIDMWSLGCIAVELFLGLPLFPGTSEYNQICRIVEMLGLPPAFMLDQGKQTGEFFSVHSDEYGRKTYRLKSLEQYSKEHNTQEQPSKKYFQATTLPEIIKTYPMPRKSGRPADVPKEMASRTCFIDFVTGLLNMDPAQRWTPQQARKHPFITNEKFVEPYKPPPTPSSPTTAARTSKAANATVEAAKHPYGGLPQTPSRGSGRAYPDAAAYNQHLAQQQAYNSAHQARQSQPPPVNNPYAQDAQAQAQAQAKAHAQAQQQQQQHQQAHAQAHAQAQAQAQAAAAHHAAVSPQGYAAPPANATGVQTRSRSNTMTRMDTVPPQLAKLGLDSTPHSGANLHSATPVLTREESLREWERRQQQNGGGPPMPQQLASGGAATGSGRARTTSNYGNLDLLQHGTAAAGWSQQWSGAGSSAQRQSSQGQPGAYASPSGSAVHSPPGGQPPGAFSVIVDGQDRRMVNPHDAMSASSAMANMPPHGASGMSGITQPPQAAYSSASSGPSQASRYQPPASSTYGAAGMSFDPYDTGIAQLMPALKPTQYQGSQAGAATQRHSVAVTPGGGSSYAGLQPIKTAASPSGLRGDDGFGMPGFDGRRYSQQQHPQMQQQHPPAASPQGHQRF